MGMSQTRVLNEPPYVTARDRVDFTVPMHVLKPETDEGIMMLSVLERQDLLRTGQITLVELTQIELANFKK